MGAEFLRKEYASISPWVGYSGYLVALATGYLRIYNNRHYFNDVLAGACIGILSTKFAYWVYPLIFKRTACKNHRFRMVTFPVYQEGSWGVGMKMQF
jgi:membrane-associated phospholipid phosphatase